MKKIIIITAYSGNNFGSSLQAFALKEYLSRLGYSSFFIKVVDSKIYKLKITTIRLLKGLIDWHLLKKEIKNKFSKKSNNSLVNENDTFEKNYFDIKEISRKELKKLAYSDSIDYCIVGSDQIWNPEDAYLDPNIFLKFSPMQKNIAYAASFGQDYIYKYNLRNYKKGLRNINSISCREESGCNLCKKLGFQCTETLDPTFLFSKSDWMSFFNLKEYNSGRVLLLYFIGPIHCSIKDKIKDLAKKFDKTILLTKYNQTIEGVTTVNATVVDFVEYIIHSSFVITDSYHGTIFSINFGIPFYTISRIYLNADGDNNERVSNILNKVSLQNRLLTMADFLNVQRLDDINYTNVHPIINKLRDKSKKFLQKSLNISTK